MVGHIERAFECFVDEETFAQTLSGRITGAIFVRLGETFFPEPGWSDFPLVLLANWLAELKRLQQGRAAATLHFMDGPFQLHVSPADDTWRIVAQNRGLTGVEEVARCEQHSEAVIDTLRSAALPLLNWATTCKETSHVDVARLRAEVRERHQ